jgi:hypothetical protein
MAAYHVVLVHFPIALWMTATLAILWRAISKRPIAQAVDRALIPLLSIGLMSGIVAILVGQMVWPWDAISTSPMGRNHILLAIWTTAYWALMLVTRWIQGEAIWDGPGRWVMAGLSILGSGLLGITGTLGGHLSGSYTDLSKLLRALGWEVHRTYYVPNMTLGVIVAAAISLVVLGLLASRRVSNEVA